MIIKFRIPAPYSKDFKVDVKVSQDGQFRGRLDTATETLFKACGIKLDYQHRFKYGYFSNTLQGIQQAIGADIVKICSIEEVSRETILRFSISTMCSYVKLEAGDFGPNGCWPGAIKDAHGGCWHIGTVDVNATNTSPTGIEFCVVPYTKITEVYGANGELRVTYDKISTHLCDGVDPGSPLDWLASLTCQAMPSNDTWHEIPYTYEAGMFFMNLYKSMYRMNEAIKPYLNKDGIIKLIEMNNTKLLGG